MNMFCFKTFHCRPGFMFRVVVLLEGEPPPESFADSNRFSSKIALYLAPSIFPWTLTIFPVPAEEKHLQSMMLPPRLTVGMVCSEWCSGLVFRHIKRFAFRPKSSSLVSSDQSTFFHVCCVPHMASGKLQTGLLTVLTMALFLPLLHKGQICAVHD